MSQLIVDRIEGEIAVCEAENGLLQLPLAQIAGPVREGDMLLPAAGGGYMVDKEATEARRAQLAERFQRLKK